MTKIVLFTILLVIAIVFVTARAAENPKEKTCSPWLGYCQLHEQCCRHMTCAGYRLKCIPTGGLVIPGKDKRPIGPGPYPPNFLENPDIYLNEDY